MLKLEPDTAHSDVNEFAVRALAAHVEMAATACLRGSRNFASRGQAAGSATKCSREKINATNLMNDISYHHSAQCLDTLTN